MPSPFSFLPEPARPRTPDELRAALVEWAVQDMHARMQGDAPLVFAVNGRLHEAEARDEMSAPLHLATGKLSRALDLVERVTLGLDHSLSENAAERQQLRMAIIARCVGPALLGETGGDFQLTRLGFTSEQIRRRYEKAYAHLRATTDAPEAELRARAVGRVVRDLLLREDIQPSRAAGQVPRRPVAPPPYSTAR